MTPTIYLFFKGNCMEAMTHYAETLGGEIGDVFATATYRIRKAGCRAAMISS